MNEPKIVFMGTPEFAVPGLEILLKNNYNIAAVVTAPDKPQGRGLKMEFSDIKKFAIKNNLYILQPEKLKDITFIEQLRNISPDIIVIVAFRILPREVYSLAKSGAFNLHASLLPKYRGAAPINWAIINGESETGATTFFLEDKIDTGNIILQEKIPIGENETAGDLHDKLSVLGAELIFKTVNLIQNGDVKPYKQQDTPTAPAPKIYKEDCIIKWDKQARVIHNFIRGLSPYPGAYTYYKDKIIKIYQGEIINVPKKGQPGEILDNINNLIISTGDMGIKVFEIQLEGRKKMMIDDFLRGFEFSKGDCFKF